MSEEWILPLYFNEQIENIEDFISIVRNYKNNRSVVKFPLSVYEYYFDNIDNCKPYIHIDPIFICLTDLKNKNLRRNIKVNMLSINTSKLFQILRIELDNKNCEILIDGFDYCITYELQKLKIIKDINFSKNINLLVDGINNINSNNFENLGKNLETFLDKIQKITVFGFEFINVNQLIISDNICIPEELMQIFTELIYEEMSKYCGFFEEEEQLHQDELILLKEFNKLKNINEIIHFCINI